MAEPTMICPNCKVEIKLTESLAAPIIEATRRQYEQRMAEKRTEGRKREAAVREQQEALAKVQASIDEQVASKLKEARVSIAADEAKRARLALSADLDQESREVSDLQEALTQRDMKLAEAQQAQLDLIRRQRELDAEQGSQQLQGEVQELELESLLRQRFPQDAIEPAPKGEHGGDVLQRVVGSLGLPSGTIIWEAKRTKNWSDAWVPKHREDQRVAMADIAVLVTQSLPTAVEAFDLIDGVWVVHPSVLVPVALLLRQSLVEVASARRAGEGQETKMEMVYELHHEGRLGERAQSDHQAVGEAARTDRPRHASDRGNVRRPPGHRGAEPQRNRGTGTSAA